MSQQQQTDWRSQLLRWQHLLGQNLPGWYLPLNQMPPYGTHCLHLIPPMGEKYELFPFYVVIAPRVSQGKGTTFEISLIGSGRVLYIERVPILEPEPISRSDILRCLARTDYSLCPGIKIPINTILKALNLGGTLDGSSLNQAGRDLLQARDELCFRIILRPYADGFTCGACIDLYNKLLPELPPRLDKEPPLPPVAGKNVMLNCNNCYKGFSNARQTPWHNSSCSLAKKEPLKAVICQDCGRPFDKELFLARHSNCYCENRPPTIEKDPRKRKAARSVSLPNRKKKVLPSGDMNNARDRSPANLNTSKVYSPIYCVPTGQHYDADGEPRFSNSADEQAEVPSYEPSASPCYQEGYGNSSPAQATGYTAVPFTYPTPPSGYPAAHYDRQTPPYPAATHWTRSEYPSPQNSYPEVPSKYPSPQTGYPEAPSTYLSPQNGYPDVPSTFPPQQSSYPQTPSPYQSPQSGYTQVPSKYPSSSSTSLYPSPAWSCTPPTPTGQYEGTSGQPTGPYNQQEVSIKQHEGFSSPNATPPLVALEAIATSKDLRPVTSAEWGLLDSLEKAEEPTPLRTSESTAALPPPAA